MLLSGGYTVNYPHYFVKVTVGLLRAWVNADVAYRYIEDGSLISCLTAICVTVLEVSFGIRIANC